MTDFTCIGPAANLAGSLERLTSKLGRARVVSEAFAKLCDRERVALRSFDLMGVPEPAHVFAPA